MNPPVEDDIRHLKLRVQALEERVADLQSSRPLCCYDCGRRYEKGPDLIVSREDWEKIAPTDGEGVLCPNCMHDRFVALGVPTGSVCARFKSGPFAEPEAPSHWLWCVHVLGPDTLIAQPSHLAAEQFAATHNRMIEAAYSRDEPSEFDPIIWCVVIPWTGSPEGHSADLARHGGNPEDIC